jgi:hypothetical protein
MEPWIMKHIKQSFEGIRSPQVVDAIESVMANSYAERLEALQAESNDGEAALIADPVESQAWYVNLPSDFLSENDFRQENRHEIAAFVLRWTAWMDDPSVARDASVPPPTLKTPTDC